MYNEIDSNKRKTILLMVIFTLIILLIGWTFSQLTNAGYPAVGLAAFVAIIMSLGGYYAGDKLALATASAQGPISEADSQALYHIVENLCITAGIPMPKIYVMPDPAINAFACGRNPQHASLAVTQGAIDKLTKDEMEGVIAHELSHVRNYDILLMTVIVVMVGLIALLSDWFLRIRFWGGGKSSKDEGGGQLQVVLMIVGVVLLILSPIIGQLIQLAVSRKREYLADASGALLTRYPAGLANALQKIANENQPLDHANSGTAHMYIASPFGGSRKFISGLFSTHPPIEERIAILRKMA